MSYYHLTISERESILELTARGHSIRSIALRLKRNPSTVLRELRRCPGKYSPSKAQQDYRKKRKRCHKPLVLQHNSSLCELIAQLIQSRKWSPEQISNRLRLEGLPSVSYATIYRYIESHNLGLPLFSHGNTGIRRSLRHRGRK